MQERTNPSTSLTRRRALKMLGVLGTAPLLSCGSDSTGLSGSDVATLGGLTLSSGTLTPSFAPGTLSYTAGVSNDVTAITVTPTATDANATITVNGTAVASGSASGNLDLTVGTNAITIIVTAEDGTSTGVYSVVVTRAGTGAASCVLIPQETDGPYPLYSVLGDSAMVRSDIREGKTGVPLALTLTLVDVNQSCEPISNAAVYIWHCDKEGEYSGYSNGANGDHTSETYLRGIQVSDANGQVTFTTIFPGWYAGRITHIHFEVFLNDNVNVTATATSQIAFPQSVTSAVYGSSLYAAHGQNTSVTSFAEDNVFSDGTEFQLANISGDTTNGYTAALTVGVAV